MSIVEAEKNNKSYCFNFTKQTANNKREIEKKREDNPNIYLILIRVSIFVHYSSLVRRFVVFFFCTFF